MARSLFRRRVSYLPGTCSPGCWPESRDGRTICVCGDTLLKGPLDFVAALPTSVKVLAGVAAGAVAGYVIARR